MEFAQSQWESFLKVGKFEPVKHGIEKGLASMKKYYKLTDNSDANIICVGTLITLFIVAILF